MLLIAALTSATTAMAVTSTAAAAQNHTVATDTTLERLVALSKTQVYSTQRVHTGPKYSANISAIFPGWKVREMVWVRSMLGGSPVITGLGYTAYPALGYKEYLERPRRPLNLDPITHSSVVLRAQGPGGEQKYFVFARGLEGKSLQEVSEARFDAELGPQNGYWVHEDRISRNFGQEVWAPDVGHVWDSVGEGYCTLLRNCHDLAFDVFHKVWNPNHVRGGCVANFKCCSRVGHPSEKACVRISDILAPSDGWRERKHGDCNKFQRDSFWSPRQWRGTSFLQGRHHVRDECAPDTQYYIKEGDHWQSRSLPLSRGTWHVA